MKIIDGKKIAEKIKDDLAKNIFELAKKEQRRPGLAVILVGEREDSKLYVSLKEKSAKEIGVDTSLYLISEADSEEDIINTINFLNQDEEIDGILVQLPLPKKFNTDKILKMIKPEKDVDGFSQSKDKFLFSPVVLSVDHSLADCKINLKDKKVFLFCNSNVFKNEMADFLLSKGARLDFIKKEELENILKNGKEDKKKNLYKRVKKNDILITAMGKPEIIDKNFLKDKMILIDIGITKLENKVLGDIKKADIEKLEGYFTPVPGGVGPMTIACLLKNVLQAYLFKK
ncbi:MAG: bifunctional 5,10-methylenetetrahydrofolate dehydrogenase/5,10-methenyltetrahydrofolate cyclohydrolase [Patescibacteria group bacterium]|nr:bifunctional 5,10-methylenetetrahydrofolate dehydrogenase/5,10-methenyltetrahydrofolate cyclohydrolase [Patescibacteria group bacterium]